MFRSMSDSENETRRPRMSEAARYQIRVRGHVDAAAARRLRGLMKRVAKMLRNHREQILNWFRARGQISAAAAEGLNGKAKVTTRRSYGFRGLRTASVALYHTLGELPEPEFTHRFC